MEALSVAKHCMLRPLVFYNFVNIFWLYGMESWHEGEGDCDGVCVWMLCKLQLRYHHVIGTVIEIQRVPTLRTNDCDSSAIFVLLHSSTFWDT